MDTKANKSKSDLTLKARNSIDYLFYLTNGNAFKALDLVLKKISKLIKSISRALDIPKHTIIGKNTFELSKSLVLGCKRILYVLKTNNKPKVTTGITPINGSKSQEVVCVESDSTQEIVPQLTRSHKGSQVDGDNRVKCEVMKHIIDHQGVTDYYSGRTRYEVYDQISVETVTLDRKLEYSIVMDKLAEWNNPLYPWYSYPITVTQQQRARIQVLFGLASADEHISKILKEARLRDYLLDHIHNLAEKKVKESFPKFDFTRYNYRGDNPEYLQYLQNRLMAIRNAKIDILHAVDRGEMTLSPDYLKIYSGARRLWFADHNEYISLEEDIYYVKDNPHKSNKYK